MNTGIINKYTNKLRSQDTLRLCFENTAVLMMLYLLSSDYISLFTDFFGTTALQWLSHYLVSLLTKQSSVTAFLKENDNTRVK